MKVPVTALLALAQLLPQAVASSSALLAPDDLALDHTSTDVDLDPRAELGKGEPGWSTFHTLVCTGTWQRATADGKSTPTVIDIEDCADQVYCTEWGNLEATNGGYGGSLFGWSPLLQACMANCTCQLTDKVDWHTSNKYWACIAQPAWGCSGGPSGYMGWGPSRSCKRGERWPGDWDGRPAPFPPGLPEPPALGTRSPRNFGLPMGNGTLFVLEMPPDVLALVASLEANMTGAADGRRAGRAEKVQPSPQWTHPYHRPGTATRCDWQSWERIMSDADRMGAVNVLMDWCACAGNGIPAGKMVGYRSDKDILAFAWSTQGKAACDNPGEWYDTIQAVIAACGALGMGTHTWYLGTEGRTGGNMKGMGWDRCNHHHNCPPPNLEPGVLTHSAAGTFWKRFAESITTVD